MEDKNTNMLSNEELIKRLEEAKRNIEEYVSKGYDEPTLERTMNRIEQNNKILVRKPNNGLKTLGFVNTVLLGLVFVTSMLITTVCVVFRIIK